AFSADNPPADVVSELARDVHPDTALIEAALKGQPWTEVPHSTLEERAKDIVALTLPAFVHYVPAFMCAALERPDGDCATYAMYALCPLGGYDAFYEGTCALFTKEQAKLIEQFLKALEKDPSFTLFTEEIQPGRELWKRRANA
ncbi:MAG: hypothetical protein IH945_06195, partial [Armatimonadetes bacterium]|nr:hypothetical protein [Armatimonadota bacterium]